MPLEAPVTRARGRVSVMPRPLPGPPERTGGLLVHLRQHPPAGGDFRATLRAYTEEVALPALELYTDRLGAVDPGLRRPALVAAAAVRPAGAGRTGWWAGGTSAPGCCRRGPGAGRGAGGGAGRLPAAGPDSLSGIVILLRPAAQTPAPEAREDHGDAARTHRRWRARLSCSMPSAKPNSSTSTRSTRAWTSCGTAARRRWPGAPRADHRHAAGPDRAGRLRALHAARLRQLEGWRTGSASAGSTCSTAQRRYVGRLGLSDDEHRQLLVDWRAPAAEPFYRATAAAPGRRGPAPAPGHPGPRR